MTDHILNQNGIRQLCSNGFILFNYFIRLEYESDQDTLGKLFNRGAALFLLG